MSNAMNDALAAEAAAIRAHQEARFGKRPSRYAGFKTPGMDTTRIFSDPCSILKDSETRRASGDQYLWRKPDDPYTKSMCLRGVLRPIMAEEVDSQSPYANIDLVKIITSKGPRQVVRTPGGMGLFVCKAGMELSNQDQGLLPGEQWEAAYEEELAEQKEQFAGDMETLSQSSLMGRVTGEITQKETQREAIL